MTDNTPQSIDRHFRSALHNITRDPRFNDANIDKVFRYITQTTADVLGCHRVSIWEYRNSPESGEHIANICQYVTGQGHSVTSATLGAANNASFFACLARNDILVVTDSSTDLRCIEIDGNYLNDINVRSFIDAPFLDNGELAGVICLEQVGSPRQWTTTEQNFCANMANLVTLALERNNRRQTEQFLREEEDRYRSLVENLATGFVIIVSNHIVYANKAAAETMHMKNAEDMLGVKITDILKLKQPALLRQWVLGHEHIRASQPTEYRLKLWDDTMATLEITASAVTWEGSQAIQVIFRDNTDIAYAQQRLKRSERLLSQAQRIARMGSWVWDLESNETECSLGLRRILGLKKNPIEAPIVSFAHPEDTPRLRSTLETAIQTGSSYEITYRVQIENAELWLEENGVPELGPNQQVARIHGVSRDITHQKIAEKRARATEGRFTNLGNSFPGGFFYCDLSANCLSINDTLAAWLDIEANNHIDKSIATLIGEQVYQEIEPHIESVLSGQSVTFERDADFIYPGIDVLHFTLAPDIDSSGGMHGFFGLVTDITELRRVERALRQAQKMEAMGQLTGGIAHDFNNILAILMGNLELACSTAVADESREYIMAALQGVERGVAITQKLLGFARSDTRGTERVQIDELIDNCTEIIRQSVGSTVDLVIESQDNLWHTAIDSGDFQDAIINLAINARDAMPDGGRLQISTENRVLDDTAQRIHPNLKPGEYVLLSVTDTGIGMDAETREKLFEPFFSTKPVGKGTGLGMSMVFGFVSRSKGETLVYSARGEGTTIHIYLPRSADDKTQPVTDTQQLFERRARELILIVDDEELVAKVAESILKELGYETRVATTTDAALELLTGDQKFDLLFSDVVMPENLSGFELAKAARQVQPNIRVLLTSGFSKFQSMKNPTDENSEELARNILQKPYNRRELERSIRQVLDAS